MQLNGAAAIHQLSPFRRPLSARRYAGWDAAVNSAHDRGTRRESDLKMYAYLARTLAVSYTPTVGSTLREL